MTHKPVDDNDLMQRTRAAVTYCNTSSDPGVDLTAFMALFHPEVPQDEVRRMAQAVREEGRQQK